jgi:membrane protein YdbS with pleckstrin-like domain
MSDNKLVLVLRKTRKAFLPEYFCVLILLAFPIYFYYMKMELNSLILYLTIGMAFFTLGFVELSRAMSRYEFTKEKLTIIDGIIKRHKKHVSFYAIGFLTDINVSQSALQRSLGYGTIYVEGGGANAFAIKDVSEPHQVMKKIEGLISMERKSIHKIQNQT